jgi:molecular chaperone GrpE (heat shock protein)
MIPDIISSPVNDIHDQDVDINIDNNFFEKEDKKGDINENLILLAINENKVKLNELKDIFNERIRYDEGKDDAFNRLYEIMKADKEHFNELDGVLEPIFNDLLLLFDSISNVEEKSLNEALTTQEIKNLKIELLEVLSRRKVYPIEVNLEEKFDSNLHRATKIEETHFIEDDNKITKITRLGFKWKGNTLRVHDVLLKKFKEI